MLLKSTVKRLSHACHLFFVLSCNELSMNVYMIKKSDEFKYYFFGDEQRKSDFGPKIYRQINAQNKTFILVLICH